MTQSIVHNEWNEVMECLETDAGREMAKDTFKESLPLHMACERGAPPSVVESLLTTYRSAAAIRGKNGEYPLHIAAERNVNPDILVRLIKAYPQALDKWNDRKMFPRDFNQKKQINKEAVTRPTACWIEDVEKEEYFQNVTQRKNILQQNIIKIQCELTIFKERRNRAKELLTNVLEPQLVACNSWVEERTVLQKRIQTVESQYQQRLKNLKQRLQTIQDTMITKPLTEEQIKMRSFMKSSYMTAIQKRCQTFANNLNQIQFGMDSLRHVARNRLITCEMRDDESNLTDDDDDENELPIHFQQFEEDDYLKLD